MKKRILKFIEEGCTIAIWMGLIWMTYSLLVIIRNGTFGINANWQDVALLAGTYVLWFFAYSWNPKSKKQLNQAQCTELNDASPDKQEDNDVEKTEEENKTDDQCS